MKAKLDLNEPPFKPPERVLEAAKRATELVNRYPPSDLLEEVRSLLAEYCRVEPERIVITPGGDAHLEELTWYFAAPRGVVVAPKPCFFMYHDILVHLKVKTDFVVLQPPGFELNEEEFYEKSMHADLVYVDNPNNPTGKLLLEPAMIEKIASETSAIVLVDEAYYEFTNVTAAHLVKEHPNLAVARTMSKAFCIAGLRVGYAILGDKALQAFHKETMEHRVSTPSLAAAAEALRDPSYAKEVIAWIHRERERVRRELERMGFDVVPSITNFLLVNTRIPDVARMLAERGVLVRSMEELIGVPGYIRVSIGSIEENNAFLEEIERIVNNYGAE